MKPLLEVKSLRTSFFTDAGEVRAVDGVSFSVEPGKLMGIVGESGSGKTASVLSIMRLLPESARIVGGEVIFEDQDLLKLSEPEMRHVRGARIAMIFQEPMTSLNPVFTIGSQIGEAVRLHQQTIARETRNRTIEALRMVGIADPERRIDDYPHQLSGGMRQRVMIAMALSCNPRLLIADEPTTALDVTIQAQILDLIRELAGAARARRDSRHARSRNRRRVCRRRDDSLRGARDGAGADARSCFEIRSIRTRADCSNRFPASTARRHHRLQAIPGSIPSALNPPSGCRFHPRCPRAIPKCSEVDPPLENKAPNHYVACIRV